MPPDYDCVVIGAGLVGSVQALALGQLGLNVAVVDRRGPLDAATVSDARGLALAPSSRQVLEGLDLWAALSPRLTRIRHIHISDQGRFGITRLSAEDVDLEALGYVCPADHLLACLETELLRQGSIFWQSELKSIAVRSDLVTLQLHSETGTTKITARLVVGADGLNSQVREAMGVTMHSRDYRQSAIVANLTLQYPQSETAFERFTRGGPLALLPLDNGRHVAVRCCGSEQVEQLMGFSDAQYLASLADAFGHRFGAFSDLSKRSIHPLSLSWAQRIVDQRIALVGAAANNIHPNGAQGLNLGLRDVAALAARIGAALRVGEDIGGDHVLQEFSRARQSDQRAVIRFTDTLAQLFSTTLPPLGLIRDAAMIALDMSPAAKRWLIGYATGSIAKLGRSAH